MRRKSFLGDIPFTWFWRLIFGQYGGFALLLLLSLVGPLTSYGQDQTTLIENLFAPGPQPGTIGNFNVVLPGKGFGIDLTTGPTAYSVDSLTLEFQGNTLPGPAFDAQILTAGPYQDPPFSPYGQLGNPTFSSQPTQWPGITSFINFTPSSPIVLQPGTTYIIALSEAANGNNGNALRFSGYGPASAYTYGGDVVDSTYADDFALNNGVWSEASFASPILALQATAVPEPKSWTLLGIGAALARLGHRRIIT
jgi:hypothetical protein